MPLLKAFHMLRRAFLLIIVVIIVHELDLLAQKATSNIAEEGFAAAWKLRAAEERRPDATTAAVPEWPLKPVGLLVIDMSGKMACWQITSLNTHRSSTSALEVVCGTYALRNEKGIWGVRAQFSTSTAYLGQVFQFRFGFSGPHLVLVRAIAQGTQLSQRTYTWETLRIRNRKTSAFDGTWRLAGEGNKIGVMVVADGYLCSQVGAATDGSKPSAPRVLVSEAYCAQFTENSGILSEELVLDGTGLKFTQRKSNVSFGDNSVTLQTEGGDPRTWRKASAR